MRWLFSPISMSARLGSDDRGERIGVGILAELFYDLGDPYDNIQDSERNRIKDNIRIFRGSADRRGSLTSEVANVDRGARRV